MMSSGFPEDNSLHPAGFLQIVEAYEGDPPSAERIAAGTLATIDLSDGALREALGLDPSEPQNDGELSWYLSSHTPGHFLDRN